MKIKVDFCEFMLWKNNSMKKLKKAKKKINFSKE
jgi:hypothetical protein